MWVNNSTNAFRHQIGWIQQVAFSFSILLYLEFVKYYMHLCSAPLDPVPY
jgi:hypothetical protein